LVVGTVRKSLLVAVVAVVALELGGCQYLSAEEFDKYGRSQLDLLALTKAEKNPDWPYLDVSDVTEEVCGPVTDCVQAVRSEYITWTKFRSIEEAARYAKGLGKNGEQLDPLVINFDGKPVTAEQRKEIVEGVSGINASSPD
jgi:hypothetical protein